MSATDLSTVTRTTVESKYRTVFGTGTAYVYSYTTSTPSPMSDGRYVTTTYAYKVRTRYPQSLSVQRRQLAAAITCLVFALALMSLLAFTYWSSYQEKEKKGPSAIPLATHPEGRNALDDSAPVAGEGSPRASPQYEP